MELFDTHFVQFGQVLAVSGQKTLAIVYKKPICRSGKITTAPKLFSDYSLKNTNKHQIMNVHTKWNCLIPFCSVWSGISCFRPENISYKKPICRSGKITTAPRLFSDYSLKNENKHQIMNVHTKWKCLIPILFSLVRY